MTFFIANRIFVLACCAILGVFAGLVTWGLIYLKD